MALRVSPEIGGYVLAGGKSSRMGRDKALLLLGGKPLVQHAVMKLRGVCREVHILRKHLEPGLHAPLVPDLRENCGPLGGIEAGLTHSRFDWNLFMPVDMPFLPVAFLNEWVRMVLAREGSGARIGMFSVEGIPQPALSLLHREVTPYIAAAVEADRYKLFPVLEDAGKNLASCQGVLPGDVLLNLPWEEASGFAVEAGACEPLTTDQNAAKSLWFANLNTPEEFAEAEQHLDALDT